MKDEFGSVQSVGEGGDGSWAVKTLFIDDS